MIDNTIKYNKIIIEESYKSLSVFCNLIDLISIYQH